MLKLRLLLFRALNFLADSRKLSLLLLNQLLNVQDVHGPDLSIERLQLCIARLKVGKLDIQVICPLPVLWALPVVAK
ncbi:hypothetical protein Pres01_05370 [Metapseudomonas resinovorans]|nr:hypothetical protein Pres01_05370 [Pseudomonas resinovorans]